MTNQNNPAETIKTLIDSGATSNFINPSIVEKLRIPKRSLETPRVVRMLDGTLSQTGKIWHKVEITVGIQQHVHSIPFLVCPIGKHEAILGMRWLSSENPKIEWATGTITFPKEESAAIASEEETDPNPLSLIPPEYHEFAQVFGEEEFKILPPHRDYDIGIELTPEASLFHGPIYGMTDAESQALKEHLDTEVTTGKIRPSKSPAGAPVMFVKKADGSLRLVVDYRKLNEVTIKDVYPLPRQDDLMAKLRDAKIFTKLDLQWGYNNVRIKEGDEWKTAFKTKYRLFEYLVMPFGLTNAPAAFQRFMNNLFRNLLDITMVVYLDDILIFSKDPAEHSNHVREVLQRLARNQLFCKLLKCHFHVTTVEYLGIWISPLGFSMDEKKVEAVTSWPTPKSVKQVQPFLGFKDKSWKWGEPEDKSFQELKRRVTNWPVLAHSNPDKPYFLETDALGVAMGAILSQRTNDGRLHPIAYMLKSFNNAEQNYDTHDKELLAIIKALEEWRIFLEGTPQPITVFTDHRNLEYWQKTRSFNRRHARWQLYLADFNFEIHFRPGKQSGKPNALSRRADHADIPPKAEVMIPDELFVNIAKEEQDGPLQNQIKVEQRRDPSLDNIIEFLTVKQENAPPTIRKAYRDYRLDDEILLFQDKVLVPDNDDLKREILKFYHDSPLAGHPGQQQTLELVSRYYTWPGKKGWIKAYVESCDTCQRMRRAKAPALPLKPLEVPPSPFHTISYDFITGFPKSKGMDTILVVIDSFTKFGHFIPTLSKATARDLADLFVTNVWKLHGLPVKTISDRGTTFTGKFLRGLYKCLGIDPHFSSTYHPESDGQTERVNQFIEHFLRSYVKSDQTDWLHWLPLAEFAYNNAKHSAMQKSPFQLLFGRNPVMNPSELRIDVPEANDLADRITSKWKEAESAL
ncbi:Retrotransposable element Tf2 155 kDa protein type 1 OS=Schizosaccharomyces pombe (strain 972 / ATCC 24843) GN=Tf2-1 PE=4 SV=1 [Rhizoctonia solani AG-1 IB]|uniref:RNA-directed DNA polymerase n=1 Tax=Thanatephorus cucumeris (strain AG1-IB / isolate 7/3/14) TaxID=1108050 RepID=A0A0B7FV03_THACB|nr:Retrotransposable element Tf2 155 kDa protein type 1 OS=Schizosaccharomyces pombe (strain 972 / ATCC 24843) GN=Tf2-1 PE=4 SV=1 [Rhizoctonia solani AG-1 IB]